MIRHNFGYKLMALAVAVVLWSYVNGERNPQTERTFAVPVKALNVAQGFQAEPEVSEVTVKVKGPKLAVEAVGREDLTAFVDVGKPGDKTDGQVVTAKVMPSVSQTEGEITVTVVPNSIRVRLDKLSGQRRPVEVRFPTVPPLGYAYSNPTIAPSSVSIEGKDSDVARVRHVILTLPSRADGKPVDDSFPVTPLDANGAVVGGVRLDPDTVRLKLEMVEAPAAKRVIVSPDVTGSPAAPAKVTGVDVEPSLVTLQGKPAALTQITTVDTEPISIQGEATTITREVGLRLPPGVNAADANRVRVTVRISSAGE